MRLPSFQGGPTLWRICAKYGKTFESRERSRVFICKLLGDAVLFAEGFRNRQFPGDSPSIEFVAKPHEAHRAQLAIPSALAGALKEVTGFAGCLVMVSDQEARLLTVVTLWSGDERQKLPNENLRWVRALLAPYLDRCLRVQILGAHLPPLAATLPAPDVADDSSVEDCLSSEKKPLVSLAHLIMCERSAS